jgi:hypothetical protein
MSTVRFEEQAGIADQPGMITVTIDEACQLGQLVNRVRLGPALDQVGATS